MYASVTSQLDTNTYKRFSLSLFSGQDDTHGRFVRPKEEIQSYTTPMEDAPSGVIARGHYTVKSLFTDDDGNEHLKWEWSFNIKKDWN